MPRGEVGADRARSLLKQAGADAIGQTELAKRSKVSQSHISRILSGQAKTVGSEKLDALLRALESGTAEESNVLPFPGTVDGERAPRPDRQPTIYFTLAPSRCCGEQYRALTDAIRQAAGELGLSVRASWEDAILGGERRTVRECAIAFFDFDDSQDSASLVYELGYRDAKSRTTICTADRSVAASWGLDASRIQRYGSTAELSEIVRRSLPVAAERHGLPTSGSTPP